MALEDISDGMLRAWAECGVISSARYVEEVERRRQAQRIAVEAPPRDYALDDELTIPFVHHDNFLDLGVGPLGPMPPPPTVKWVALFAAVILLVVVLVVLP
jgi:hypothetical protein